MHNAARLSLASPTGSLTGSRPPAPRLGGSVVPGGTGSLPLPSETVNPMTPAKIAAFERASLKTDLTEFRVGDTVAVHYKIVEGDKLRVQVFRGIVIKRHRARLRSTFTVRKNSFSVGVERTFPVHSPRLEKVEVEARGVVRRGRLFYLRDLEGKAARVRDEKDR